jgi:hypothetical protein
MQEEWSGSHFAHTILRRESIDLNQRHTEASPVPKPARLWMKQSLVARSLIVRQTNLTYEV